MIARWLPFPLLWLSLVAMWLLLNETLSAAQALLAGVVAFVAVRGLALLQAPFGPVRRLGVAAALAGVVAIDIARSNIAVARIVLRWRTRTRRAGFVDVPLQLRNPAGLAALACIVTSTPGTAWAGYDPRRNVVTIHVLDLVDEAGLIAATKDRYERRLMEIFPDV